MTATTHRTIRLGNTVALPADDLVTHGVIVGMTGSGKTGLGIGLIEESLSAGIPVLAIDPKGDLANLGLVFPGLTAGEFEPWVDEAQARAVGMSIEQYADAQAQTWRTNLAAQGIGPADMQRYSESAQVSIYTPGSSAGIALNLLGSLKAPQADPESLTDEASGYTSVLLDLVGIKADPVSSREHILVSTLITRSWSQGLGLDLPTLLDQISNPPIHNLGAFDIDEAFPAKDRRNLAMRINSVLAAPGFASWIGGQDVDIESMLWSPDGSPRCAVVSTAHLMDDERQRATALILNKFVTWMRRQSGTSTLRALLYMDEVAGYLPPTANPPTKRPIMLLMKQARAFGVGVVLATQNPVDIDYKALSNAGTWMIGRLTTRRDKARLLEGLATAAGGLDLDQVSEAISGLHKRQFLLRRVGSDQVDQFTTRWTRSYLRGPLSRDQIMDLTGGSRISTGTDMLAARFVKIRQDKVTARYQKELAALRSRLVKAQSRRDKSQREAQWAIVNGKGMSGITRMMSHRDKADEAQAQAQEISSEIAQLEQQYRRELAALAGGTRP